MLNSADVTVADLRALAEAIFGKALSVAVVRDANLGPVIKVTFNDGEVVSTTDCDRYVLETQGDIGFMSVDKGAIGGDDPPVLCLTVFNSSLIPASFGL